MSFKICTIGCGGMSSSGHGPSYKKYASLYSDTILAACCDIDAEKALAYKNSFGFQRYYTDMDKMLDTEKPDAVCVIVPVKLTAAVSISVLEKGYPLIMEKPPGLNGEETRKMIEAADKHNTPTQVAFNRRYMPMVRKLKTMISQAGSSIQNFRYDFYRVERFDEDFSTTAIHGVDAARFLAASDFRHINFHYQTFTGFGTGVANILMDCEFESGAAAQLSFCPISGVVVERAVVNAFNHTWLMNLPIWNAADFPGSLVHYEKGRLAEDISGREITPEQDLYITNGFYSENESFFNDIKAGRKPAGDLRSVLQSVEVADSIRKRKTEYAK